MEQARSRSPGKRHAGHRRALLVLTFRFQLRTGLGLRHCRHRHLPMHERSSPVVFRRQFGWSRPAALIVFVWPFGIVDFAFFAANTLKIFEGGWVPLAIGLSIVLVMTTWRAAAASSWPAGPRTACRCLLPRPPAAIAHRARAGHGRVPDRQSRFRPQRAAA